MPVRHATHPWWLQGKDQLLVHDDPRAAAFSLSSLPPHKAPALLVAIPTALSSAASQGPLPPPVHDAILGSEVRLHTRTYPLCRGVGSALPHLGVREGR